MRTAVNIVHVLVTVFLFSSEVHAVDGLAIEIGTGDEDATRGGAAVQWGWERELLSVGDWFLGGYWEFGFSYWDGDSGRTGTGSLGEVGFAPVFRIEPRTPIVGVTPYLEGAIGVHFMTETELGDRDFDIAFTFGDHLGAGLRLGPKGEFEVGYRYQHLSNLSIGDSNPGINFHLVRL